MTATSEYTEKSQGEEQKEGAWAESIGAARQGQNPLLSLYKNSTYIFIIRVRLPLGVALGLKKYLMKHQTISFHSVI